MIETGLYALLSGNSGVSALVGTAIYPDVLPDQPTLPAITYSFVGGRSEPTFNTSGVQRSRLEVNCWSAKLPAGGTRLQAATVRDAVRATLNGYQGVLSDGTNLLSALLISPGMSFFEQDLLQYRCLLEFYLLYNFTS